MRKAKQTGWLLKGLLLAMTMFVCAGTARAQGEIRIYNWSDYINPAVLDAFTRETGIKVIYDTFDQIEAAEAKLAAGKSGYDLVVVTASLLTRHIPKKLYAELDRTRLPNLSHLWPEIVRRLAQHDPGNRYAVGYIWGTTGLGFNIRKIRERLGPEARVESWAILFNPETLKKLAPCGVQVLDSPEELFPAALRYLGLNPDSKSENDLRRAAELLMKIRPYIQSFSNKDYVSALANGDICLAVGFSGEMMQAQRRAAEARSGVELGYVIPREGALMWFDSFVIPADAPNKETAHRFLDFLNRPEIAALNAGFVHYASANLAAQGHMSAAHRVNPGIYPPSDILARLYTVTPFDANGQRALARLWTRVKSGK